GIDVGLTVTSDNTVTIANTPPPAPSVSMSPTEGTVVTVFTCEVTGTGDDVDGDTVEHPIDWLVNDHVNEAVTEASVSATELKRDPPGNPAQIGDTVRCQARADDGEDTSATHQSEGAVLGNTPPQGGAVAVVPDEATTVDDLTCETVGANDPDGDTLIWSITWFVDGAAVPDETDAVLSAEHFVRGQTVHCTAYASDGTDAGEEMSSANAVTIANAAPSVPEITVTPAAGAVSQSYTCTLTAPAEDADGDDVDYTVTWLVNGFENPGALDTPVQGYSLFAAEGGVWAAAGDALQCQVVAHDGVVDGEPAWAPVIVFGNASPVGGEVTITPLEAREADLLTCQATGATDPDGETVFWLYTWMRNGEIVEGASAATLDGHHFDKGDDITCAATPTDGQSAGVEVQSDVVVHILNSVPTAPFIALTPQAGGVLSAFTCELQVEGTDDDAEDTLEHVVTWVVNGHENADAHEATRTAVGLVSDETDTPAKGDDVISCRVRADDGEALSAPGESNEVTLQNTPPQGGVVTVDPAEPTEEDTLTCLTSDAVDPDGQAVLWSYVWLVNGEQVPGETGALLSGEHFGAGDAITCVATPTDGVASGDAVPAQNTVAVANSLPSQPSVALSPSEGQAVTEFSCEVVVEAIDPDGDLISYEKRWIVNGHVNALWQEPMKPLNLVSDAQGTPARGGDTLGCQARAYDGFGYTEPGLSETTVLANTAPSGGVVWISPAEAGEGDTLTCEASGGSDADGDEISWSYAWYANTEPIDGQTNPTLTSDHFGSGDVVRCHAVASDGQSDGPLLMSENAVQVGNSLPTAPEIVLDPEAGTIETLFTCSVSVASSDSDEDPITYITHWVVNGYENVQLDTETVTATELISDALGTAVRGGDTLGCRVRASDGVGLSPPADSLALTLDNTAPTGGTVTVFPETATEGDTLNCVAQDATDIDGDPITWTYTWTVDDQVLAGQTEDSLTSEHFDKHQAVSCSATPSDPAATGDEVASAHTVIVENTPPVVGSVTVEPAETNRLGTFTCVVDNLHDADPADGEVTVELQWLLETGEGFEPIVDATEAQLAAMTLSPGDQVACRATPYDSDEGGVPVTSELATVVNTPPSVGGVSLTPPFAYSDDVLTCSPTESEDIDDDEIAHSFAWFLNDVLIEGETSTQLSGGLDKGDTVRCVVTPNDGVTDGLGVPSNVVTVLNTLPSLTGATVSPEVARLCETFTCTPGPVIDPDPSDQETMDFFYRWTVNEVPIDVTTPTLTWADAAPADEVVCHVAPWDGAFDGVLDPLSGPEVSTAPVIYTNPPPTLESVTVEPQGSVLCGTTLTCAHEGYSDDCDPVGEFFHHWSLTDADTGEVHHMDYVGQELDTSTIQHGQTVYCSATASDGHAQVELGSSNGVLILNAPPVAAVVSVQAPQGADGSVICNMVSPPFDHEEITLTYYWRIGDEDEFEGGVYLGAAVVDHCDRVRCRLEVSDGELTVTSETSELIMPFGSGLDCEDGTECTDALCGVDGGCVQVHVDGSCDDGNSCTQGDTCVDKACVGDLYDCGDSDPCTDDICNGDGSCSYDYNTAPCDDETDCTIGDTCSSGLCQGTTVDCSIYDDGCFVGTCAGECGPEDECACIGASCAACVLQPATGQACDDQDECTLADQCSNTGECVGEWDKFGCGCVEDAECEADPEYNDACHLGQCDLDIFKCYMEQRPDGFECDDGEACTHTDECIAGTCTTTPYDCEDFNLCTDDSCNGDGTCTNAANTLPCDDDDACTLNDTCHLTVCVGGAPPQCDDGLYCTGQETCDELLGCQDGTDPALDDGIDCTVDSCDDDINSVVHEATDALCDTSTVCVLDTCDETSGCESEQLLNCCGNGILETGEICDDGNDVANDGCSPTCTCECSVVEQSLCIQPSVSPPSASEPAPPMAILGAGGLVATSHAHGDVDRDGDMDVLIGYQSQTTTLFLSDGAGGFAEGLALPRPAGNTSPTSALVLGDVDNDGDLDLVVGYNGDADRLVFNDGSAAPFISDGGSVLDTGALSTTAMALGDFEPNGTLDLVVTHAGDANHYLLNTFPWTFDNAMPVAFDNSVADTRDVALADVNYDGLLDIVLAQYDAMDKVYTSLGAPLFFHDLSSYDLGTDVEPSQALLVADFNRDGFDDIAVGTGAGATDRVYCHPGPLEDGTNYGFIQVPGIPMGTDSTDTRDMVTTDFDRNDAPDIVRAHSGVNDAVFNNSQSVPFVGSPVVSLDPPFSGQDTRGLELADLDRDGAPDLVTVNAGAPTLAYRFRYPAPLEGLIDRTLSTELLTTTAIAVGNVSRISAQSVVLAQASGAIHVIPNNSTGAPFLGFPALEEAGDDESPLALEIADMNRDGWLDLIVGNGGKVNSPTPVQVKGLSGADSI
ncbi:MAG: FG-GAP-like repeat-containing protein, partial [Myxococcota bacterium]|nr:FG-GAP-like repeat-containing protein [Myxococcota bacterium]